ncbi:MAG: hypothetical protein AAGI14_03280 [Pseudomonadota bacterium]
MRLIKAAFMHSVIAASLIIAPLAASAFGIGLQPTTVEIDVEPGDRQRQVINIGNVHTEDRIALTLGLADWSLDENGQIKLSPPGDSDQSASDWVRFSPAFVELDPGETEQVIVDMAAPMRVDREGDYRFALIASTILPESREGQSGVWKKYQIASLFYLTMGDATSSPAVTGADLTKREDGMTLIEVDIENTGTAHARLRGEATIKGDDTDPVTIPIANLVVLDDATRTYRIPVEEDLPTNPSLELTLENIFAPQASSGNIQLPVFESDLSFEEATLLDALDGGDETSVE